jgi:hypothetical protein
MQKTFLKYFLICLLAFGLSITAVTIVKKSVTEKVDSHYKELLDKQASTFALPFSGDSLAWARAITFLKNNSPLLASFDEYIIKDEEIRKPYVNEGHGFEIRISRKRLPDSVRYEIHIEYSQQPSPHWEKKAALFIALGIDENTDVHQVPQSIRNSK